MRNTKSAFTLVELIVVITILAILGTIAFISLQGYSADARNSKRTSDLNNIASSLNIKLTTGMGMLSLLGDATSALTTPSIGGTAAIETAGATQNYNAGIVNYSALWMKASEFQDPNDDNYVAGATTLAGWAYQLAAAIEWENGEVTKIVGTFNPRDVAAGTVTVLATTAWDTVITLASPSDVGVLKNWDTLTTAGLITKISADGMNITITTPALVGVTSLALAADETVGLIDDVLNAWTPITEASTILPY